MADVKFHKVVGSLPSTLEADAFYAVLSGSGYDLYLTDSSGLPESLNGTREWFGTMSDYNAIMVKDPDTTYYIQAP